MNIFSYNEYNFHLGEKVEKIFFQKFIACIIASDIFLMGKSRLVGDTLIRKESFGSLRFIKVVTSDNLFIEVKSKLNICLYDLLTNIFINLDIVAEYPRIGYLVRPI